MGDISKLLDLMGGGWMSLGILILFGVLMIWLRGIARKAKRDRAEKKTNAERIEDQADTSNESRKTEEAWDDTQDEMDQIRNQTRGSDQ